MSILIEIEEENVGVRGDNMDVPFHICFETLNDITDNEWGWLDHATLRIGNVAYVKDAP